MASRCHGTIVANATRTAVPRKDFRSLIAAQTTATVALHSMIRAYHVRPRAMLIFGPKCQVRVDGRLRLHNLGAPHMAIDTFDVFDNCVEPITMIPTSRVQAHRVRLRANKILWRGTRHQWSCTRCSARVALARGPRGSSGQRSERECRTTATVGDSGHVLGLDV